MFLARIERLVSSFSNSVVKSTLCRVRIQSASSMSTDAQSQSSSGIQSGKVEVNGAELYYEKAGSGPWPVLLMPGALGSTETDMKPQIEKLNRDLFTVVAFDPRGYGRSRPPERVFPINFFHQDAKDARDLMKALGHTKFSPLGWSDGGITALIAAGTYPENMHRLVIWGGNAYITETDQGLYEAVRDVSKWSERMRAPMEAMYGKEGFEKLWHAWVDGISQFLTTKNGDICKAETANITCPTLIIHGDLDAMVAMEHPDYLHKTIKGSKLIKWPKAKHNLHLRYADEFNKEVENFFTEGASSV